MVKQTESHERRTLWTEVHNLAASLKPLPALAFVIRCAMRSRLWVAETRGRNVLSEYDASIRDGLCFSLLPDHQERVQAAPGFWEAFQSAPFHTVHNEEIYRIIRLYYLINFKADPRAYDSILTGSVRMSIRKFRRGIAGWSPDRHEFRLASIPLLLDASRLAKHDGQGPLDPSEAGPLNGLWPLGPPAKFVEFEKEHPLDLGLCRIGFRGNIPGMKRKQDPTPSQGGQAAEPPGTDMDTVEQVRDSLDTDEDFVLPRVGEIDRALLAAYAGQWVAWSRDGTSILAHADDTSTLTKLLVEARVDPSQCVFEEIDEVSQI